MNVLNGTEEIKCGEAAKTERLYYLDFLRALACLCVLTVHVSEYYVATNFGSFDFWVGNILDSLARCAIPLFVMISGALFLDEKYDATPKRVLSHVMKIVIFFIFWSLCWTMTDNLIVPLIKGQAVSVYSILSDFLKGPDHFWFCYMIVGMYLIVPLLRVWIKKENKAYIEYFLILSLVFSMLFPSLIRFVQVFFPSAAGIQGILNKLQLQYVGGYTIYFILGWYLNNFEIKHKKTVIALGIGGILVSVVEAGIIMIYSDSANLAAYIPLSLHIVFHSVMTFWLIRNLYQKRPVQNTKCHKFMAFIAKYSLGIYVLHFPIVLHFRVLLETVGITSSLIGIPLTFIVAFGLSLALSYGISKIPPLKRMVV